MSRIEFIKQEIAEKEDGTIWGKYAVLHLLSRIDLYAELGEYCFRNWVQTVGGSILIEGVDEFEELVLKLKARDRMENMMHNEVSEALKEEPLPDRLRLLNDIDNRLQEGLNAVAAYESTRIEPSYKEDEMDAMWGGQNDDET